MARGFLSAAASLLLGPGACTQAIDVVSAHVPVMVHATVAPSPAKPEPRSEPVRVDEVAVEGDLPIFVLKGAREQGHQAVSADRVVLDIAWGGSTRVVLRRTVNP